MRGVAGVWKDLTDTVNRWPTTSPPRCATSAEVSSAVANGDLTKKVTVEARGEVAELADTVNTR
ncbi:histidine kinase OS=Streptomyces microflavus OX=1919 GN=HUT09_26820 PE=4 SV=1 [Streptomyces microflavus]